MQNDLINHETNGDEIMVENQNSEFRQEESAIQEIFELKCQEANELISKAGLDWGTTAEFYDLIRKIPMNSEGINKLVEISTQLEEIVKDTLFTTAIKFNRKSITRNRTRIEVLESKIDNIISSAPLGKEEEVLLSTTDLTKQETEKLNEISEKSNKNIRDMVVESFKNFLSSKTRMNSSREIISFE